MLSPADFGRVKFRRSLRGYTEEDVDNFLLQVAQDYEKIFQENQLLKKRIEQRDKKIQTVAEMEDSLKKTLVSAQRTSTEIRDDAQRKAEIILREAELNAERVVEEARQEVKDLTRRIRSLRKHKKQISLDLKEVIARYQHLLEIENEEEKEHS
ncbi:MAG: DivIVA domain-containing protein [Candidatus Wallbacteria bacterium]|nr:DivIVA domain-containing protein [Candidatus Wallbacteria bacterium]